MIKVILVDDEPFIIQGLNMLIDWKREGCEIVKYAANGQEAFEYIENNPVDLVITDIKMPVMNGLELLKNIREKAFKDISVVILSGYKDFEYAKEGLKYGCEGYVLKPVEKIELLTLVRKIAGKKSENILEDELHQDMESAFVARNLISLLTGKYDEINLAYIDDRMKQSEEMCFVSIEYISVSELSDVDESEKRHAHRKLFSTCRELLLENRNHLIFDVSREQDSLDIGLIVCDYMYKDKKASIEEYLVWIKDELESRNHIPIRIFVGKTVNKITNISKSYGTVKILKSVEGFRPRKDIYFYEDEAHVSQSGAILCKQCIDNLIEAIERDEEDRIKYSVTGLFKEMRHLGITSQTIKLNMDYLLFQLVHIAANQDSDINQEEVLQYISESSFNEGILRGSSEHLTSFAIEYAKYLVQLRKNVSGGIIYELEKDIKTSYMNNLSLRELSEKYYVNSSYLGQVFKKKYGMSFKDYLTNYRINEAALMLIQTDEKIAKIAELVGYKDRDYFIRKFIEIKGCTPSKYRKDKRN